MDTIKSLSGTFYQCKVQYSIIDEKGNDKKIKADYVVVADCCGEAETIVLTELIPLYGDTEINQVSKGKVREILYSDNIEEDRKFYETTLQLITLDERSGKEKKTTIKYLVCAKTMMAALKAMQEFMSSSMIDYNSIQIKETKIAEVITRDNKKDEEE